jgi:hypothetical protein
MAGLLAAPLCIGIAAVAGAVVYWLDYSLRDPMAGLARVSFALLFAVLVLTICFDVKVTHAERK